MVFLPKQDVLSLEEMLELSDAFIARGVRRIRLTGGEPLVRKNIMWLVQALGEQVKSGLMDEVTLTTNGTQLPKMAADLYAAGVRRINVSLDTLNAEQFKIISRRDRLETVLEGIEAAKAAGLKVKINTVAMRHFNEHEIPELVKWAARENTDITLIETMPLGDIEGSRENSYLPLTAVKARLDDLFDLTAIAYRTGGPARYFSIAGSTAKLGFITPLTNNFCDGCNRVRVTCTGRIYMCLGQDDHIDLRAALRSENQEEQLASALDRAMGAKPRGHDFAISDGLMVGKVNRHMSQTGG